ncbi:hypothetical protein DLJ53_33430 [Acuticoccus sediminis]|uniref:Uncharacterized protein n=1 Tax=Acuticoccus sediminis TaxID=2184697 RepID=A0A8B2NCL6_9HYPH|nr:hypothetical protein [Acuticoccus sediminis]RAH96052.1 hypothetical protein DLJ53_33430 [Acuticoccus sediminis]
MTKSKPTHDVVTRVGSFTGRDGKARASYRTIGAAWPDENGAINSIRLDVIPIDFDGVIYLREREERPAAAEATEGSAQ